jgi:glyoxylase-like metal-dependent hydrolase (beta-lactamase superfamily II)
VVALVVSVLSLACGHTNGASAPEKAETQPLTVQSFVATEKGFYVTSTLIKGEHDAMLVDAQFLNSEAQRLVETIRGSGLTLRTVYITHAHPDHYFGLATIHAAFPEARILAHPLVVEEIRAGFLPKHAQWKPVFGDDLADASVAVTPYAEASIDLEGHRVQLLGPQQADAEHVVSVYVPEASALIASDASYAGAHVWLADSKSRDWDAWLVTLEKLKALEPKIVISGHREPGQPDSPAALEATSAYIRDFQASVANSKSAEEVIAAMTAKYSNLSLPIVLKISAGAAFGGG